MCAGGCWGAAAAGGALRGIVPPGATPEALLIPPDWLSGDEVGPPVLLDGEPTLDQRETRGWERWGGGTDGLPGGTGHEGEPIRVSARGATGTGVLLDTGGEQAEQDLAAGGGPGTAEAWRRRRQELPLGGV